MKCNHRFYGRVTVFNIFEIFYRSIKENRFDPVFLLAGGTRQAGTSAIYLLHKSYTGPACLGTPNWVINELGHQ